MMICKHDGCKKRATYNFKDLKPKFCYVHKKRNMVNRKKRYKCLCGKKTASFGYRKDGKRVACRECKLEGMTLLATKGKCQYEDCDRRAYFPYGSARFCRKHKLPGMRSSQPCSDCDTIATFGYPGGKRETCGSHMREGMINLTNKKCPCGVTVWYGYAPNELTACASCAEEGMLSRTQWRRIPRST